MDPMEEVNNDHRDRKFPCDVTFSHLHRRNLIRFLAVQPSHIKSYHRLIINENITLFSIYMIERKNRRDRRDRNGSVGRKEEKKGKKET